MNEEKTGLRLRQTEHIHTDVRNGQPNHGGDRKSDDCSLAIRIP
jgi:hypothetical protein